MALWTAQSSLEQTRIERRLAEQRERRQQQERREERAAAEREKLIDRLITVYEAWELFAANREDLQARARLRAALAGLPGAYARQAGIAVGAPRSPYLADEFQPIHMMCHLPHREVLEGNLERLEIEHNIRQLRGTARPGGLRDHLTYFVEHHDNLYNEKRLTAEEQAQADEIYQKSLRGEPHDGAVVINGEAPTYEDGDEQSEPLTADQVRASILARNRRKNSALDRF